MMLSCWGPDQAFMKCWVTGPRRHRMKSYSPTDCWGQLRIRSCHMISLEESALSGPAFCLCHWLYWQIKSSVISSSWCTRRNSGNSDNHAALHYQMLGLLDACESETQSLVGSYSIDHGPAEVSNLSFTSLSKMSDCCFTAPLILL